MNFEFNQDQAMLGDSVRKWVAKAYPFDHYLNVVKAGGTDDKDWQQLADLGLCGLAVPEDHGGMGLGPVEAMLVAQELGAGMVCEPWAQVALMATAVLRDHAPAAMQSAWLPGIADGSKRIVLAITERAARFSLNHVSTSATKNGEHWLINGHKSIVAFADHADALLVSAKVVGQTGDDAIGLFLVQRSMAVQCRAYTVQDGSRAAEVTFDQASAQLVCAGALPALEHAVDIGIAALCAQAVGAMDKLYAITLDYLNTRKQFGVAIGTFQALRHRVADMKMQLELARSMSYFATLKLTAPAPERRYATSAAKVQIGQSMRFVGQQSVQLHGGIAVTHEYIAGHYFKYLTTIEMSLGDSYFHLGEVSNRMKDSAGVFV